MDPYTIYNPTIEKVPIIVSVPHCGAAIPDILRDEYKSSLLTFTDDIDWFVDTLYDFVSAMGIVMIKANYSRWIVDLNRDSTNKPLYNDGRIITGLCPVTNFLGEKIYRDERNEVDAVEIEKRLADYYWPYHHQLQKLIDTHKEHFGKVLLWDCHSIKQRVPTIYHHPFPDLVLGDAEGLSASPLLIETAYHTLSSGPYTVGHNFPFQGGYITRHYGKPLEQQHALQLEMSKIKYMDDEEKSFNKQRAMAMQDHLKRTLEELLIQLRVI